MTRMFRRLEKREKNRRRLGFLAGNVERMREVGQTARLVNFEIAIAQPGLSKEHISDNILELLASTELYVQETATADFTVYCNG